MKKRSSQRGTRARVKSFLKNLQGSRSQQDLEKNLPRHMGGEARVVVKLRVKS